MFPTTVTLALLRFVLLGLLQYCKYLLNNTLSLITTKINKIIKASFKHLFNVIILNKLQNMEAAIITDDY